MSSDSDQMPDILIRDHTSADQPTAGWVELTDHHRWIYHDPSIGRDDPRTASTTI